MEGPRATARRHLACLGATAAQLPRVEDFAVCSLRRCTQQARDALQKFLLNFATPDCAGTWLRGAASALCNRSQAQRHDDLLLREAANPAAMQPIGATATRKIDTHTCVSPAPAGCRGGGVVRRPGGRGGNGRHIEGVFLVLSTLNMKLESLQGAEVVARYDIMAAEWEWTPH